MNYIKKILVSLLVLSLTFANATLAFADESSVTYSSEVETNAGGITSDGETVSFTFTNNTRIPNWIGGAITPQATGFKITVTNIGIDTVDKAVINLNLYNDINGAFISSTSRTLTNIKPGNTSFTWTIAKSNTVQERIELTGTANDGTDVATIKKATTYRWNFAGGRYGSMQAMGGQRHHLPSDSVSPLSTNDGPVIRMLTADHRKTSSYGSGATAVNFRAKEKQQIDAGKFLAAQQLGINDINKLFGSAKYGTAISEMVTYTRGLGYTQ